MTDTPENPDPGEAAYRKLHRYTISPMQPWLVNEFEAFDFVADGAYMKTMVGHAKVLAHVADTDHGKCLTIDVYERVEVQGTARASMTIPENLAAAVDVKGFAEFVCKMWGVI